MKTIKKDGFWEWLLDDCVCNVERNYFVLFIIIIILVLVVR